MSQDRFYHVLMHLAVNPFSFHILQVLIKTTLRIFETGEGYISGASGLTFGLEVHNCYVCFSISHNSQVIRLLKLEKHFTVAKIHRSRSSRHADDTVTLIDRQFPL